MGVAKLHANSHLYTSGKLINGFPGRRYRLLESLPVKEFARRYKGRKINLSTRNFPASADALQKKYRITQGGDDHAFRSEEHTSELQSLMRISYAVFCLKK